MRAGETLAVQILAVVGALAGVESALGQCTAPFAPAMNYGVGALPQEVAITDLNIDGTLDLVVTNRNSNTLSVLYGLGNGTFQSAATLSAGASGPFDVFTADFNGDGRQDLAVANQFSNTVSIHMANAGGWYNAPVGYGVGSGPHGIAGGDLNGDGRLDIVTPNYGSGSVSVLLGNAGGTFTSSGNFAAGIEAHYVTIGLFNNDAFPDLAVANPGASTVSILLGNGNGTFQSAVATPAGPAGAYPTCVATGDFNADGKLDLAIADLAIVGGTPSSALAVKLGSGDGTFGPPVLYAAGVAPNHVNATDINRDGRLDLQVTDSTGNAVLMLLGNGDGTFQSGVSYPVGAGATGVRARDLNGDGWPDVVVVNPGSGSVSVLLSAGGGPAITTQPARLSVQTTQPAVFTVAAVSMGAVNYQWRMDGVNIASGVPFSGANGPTLTISAAAIEHNGAAFDCVITDTCGRSSRTNPAGLGVMEPCGSSDFNGDGDIGTDADIEAFFRVLAGENC